MKFINANLLASVGGTYDQTRTTIQGRVSQKTIGGKQVLGPSLNKFVDIVTDNGGQAASSVFMSENGRIFTLNAENAGLVQCYLHTVDFNTGAIAFVGRIQFTLPDNASTTHTYRGFKVIDTGTTGWKLFLTTAGSILINGGTFLVNNINLSDFVPIGFPTIPFATADNQKAVYFLQDPTAIGVGQLQVASAGVVLDRVQNRLYAHNGVAATHQYYVYDALALPTWSSDAVTGVAATDVISHSGHVFLDNDPIVFTSITGGAGITAGTVYFVRNRVPGVSYQISTTSGGAVLNFTTDITAAQVGRAFGTTGSNFLFKTGNLPALTGTLLINDSEDFAIPGHTSNSGQNCIFFATSTNLYLGQISELTSGATTWPSLVTSNLLGTPNQIVTPVAAFAAWSTVLDKAIYTTQTNIFVMKQVVNNSIDAIFGGNNNKYFEGLANEVVEYQMNGINGIDLEQGWLATLGISNVTGQRGVFLTDLRSDARFDHSFIVTKVLDTPSSIYKFITSLDKLFEFTGSLEVCYRTSGFGSVSGGWVALPFSEDISAFASGNQVQFKILFDTLGLDTSIPAQIYDFILGYSDLNEISNNWEYTHYETNPATNQVAYRLKKSYAVSVPNLRHTVRDLSDTLVANHTTAANGIFFEYSTDNGVNWLPLGTIPNTVGVLIRYTNNSLPALELRPALQEA
jgi:hypothetical protein